mmetsp:Transcript_11139/g.23527  ORF Transcript_11139/g.23527 Transcript_11139/m.23527 type:complete len:203 (+) Transcript_11139:944-1552(+)
MCTTPLHAAMSASMIWGGSALELSGPFWKVGIPPSHLVRESCPLAISSRLTPAWQGSKSLVRATPGTTWNSTRSVSGTVSFPNTMESRLSRPRASKASSVGTNTVQVSCSRSSSSSLMIIASQTAFRLAFSSQIISAMVEQAVELSSWARTAEAETKTTRARRKEFGIVIIVSCVRVCLVFLRVCVCVLVSLSLCLCMCLCD